VRTSLDKGSDEVADHVVEESGGGDSVDEKALVRVPERVSDGADRGRERFFCCTRGLVGVAGCEAGEVVGADHVGGGGVEGGEVQRPGAGPDIRRESGRADEFVPRFEVPGSKFGEGSAQGEDAVFVCFAQGAVAGVEICGNEFGGEDADAWGQAAIEGPVKIRGRDGCGERKGGYLAEGVHASIGATGTLGQDALTSDVVEGVGEKALDGGQAGLHLPAVVGRAVVSERDFPVRHALLCTVTRVGSRPFFIVCPPLTGASGAAWYTCAFRQRRRTSGSGDWNIGDWNPIGTKLRSGSYGKEARVVRQSVRPGIGMARNPSPLRFKNRSDAGTRLNRNRSIDARPCAARGTASSV
jgi:hypothetical protein